MPVVLVYFEWFWRNSLWKCVLQPKIAKNSLKSPIFGVQGRSRSSMLVPLESSQGCRGYGDSHGDSHGYGYSMGMGTVMNPHGFCE